jgi:uncharacterized protein with GYD domain
MTTYIVLFSLTGAGIKAAKHSPRRLDAAKKLLADMGGEMKQSLGQPTLEPGLERTAHG